MVKTLLSETKAFYFTTSIPMEPTRQTYQRIFDEILILEPSILWAIWYLMRKCTIHQFFLRDQNLLSSIVCCVQLEYFDKQGLCELYSLMTKKSGLKNRNMNNVSHYCNLSVSLIKITN